MSTWRVIRTIAPYGAIASLALIFLAFAINSFDEKLAPETLALLIAPSNPFGPEHNIYLALEGFDAPADKSALDVGQAKVALYNQQLDTMLKNPSMALADLAKADPQRLAFKGQIDFCHPRESSCWNSVQTHQAEIERLLTDNRDLYQRYLTLHQLQGYYETARPSYMAPLNFVPSEVRSLFLADVSLRMQTGNGSERHEARTDLQKDVELWRQVLIGDGRFESKMVAVASLEADYLLLADIFADPATELADASQDVVPFFGWNDWRIDNSVAAEFRTVSSVWIQTRNMYSGERESTFGAVPPWWQRLGRALGGHFFKCNATQNLSQQLMNQEIAVAQVHPSKFYEARDVYQRWVDDNVNLASVRVAYNPVGKVLIAIGAPASQFPAIDVNAQHNIATSYDDFLLRAYDGAALQRLVELSYEIRRQGIATSAIPRFLELHPEWATHPVDGRPFAWNLNTSEIAIGTLGRHRPGTRFTIRVWQPVRSGAEIPERQRREGLDQTKSRMDEFLCQKRSSKQNTPLSLD
jgi:hypothetical protein